MRTRAHCRMRRFETRQSLFPRDRGKRVQEVIEAVVSRQVVNQVSEGHTGPNEEQFRPECPDRCERLLTVPSFSLVTFLFSPSARR